LLFNLAPVNFFSPADVKTSTVAMVGLHKSNYLLSSGEDSRRLSGFLKAAIANFAPAPFPPLALLPLVKNH